MPSTKPTPELLEWMTLFEPPFTYEMEGARIRDNFYRTVNGIDNWEFLSQFPNAEAMQDSFGTFIADKLNELYEEQKP